MLEVKGIETSYGTSQVLFGMSFSVNEGEVVSLLGAQRDGQDDDHPVADGDGADPWRLDHVRGQGGPEA